jgi:hypothetical protein
MFLAGEFTGAGEVGAVNLAAARIGGQLACEGAQLRNDSGPALLAGGLQVGQDVLLRGEFTASGAGEAGAVNLRAARINGQLSCTGAKLRNGSGPALLGDGFQVDQGMFLAGGFIGDGVGAAGAVNLRGARIGGLLSCKKAQLCNDSGPALLADSLQVEQGMVLGDGFTATGAGAAGAVRLIGARSGGQLECNGAVLRNDSGPALFARGLQVDQSMFLGGGFTATGAGEVGAVNLAGARIGGQLACEKAQLCNRSGPALHAAYLQVDLSMALTNGFTAICADKAVGAAYLTGARIGGDFLCIEAKLGNGSGPALNAIGLRVGQRIFLNGGFTAIGAGVAAVVLTDARASSTFQFDPALLTGGSPLIVSENSLAEAKRLGVMVKANRLGVIAVDGLTYAGVPELVSIRDWLRLLRDGTPYYAAQPYQQLAAGHRALGHERETRAILMAQRDDELARADTRWPERLWGWITKKTLGYGYQPWRALLFLAAVVALSCLLAVGLGRHGALAQTDKTATQYQPCTVVQQVGVGLDLNLPVGTSLARAKCDLTRDSASVTAAWLSAVGWVLRLAAWVFAALFIAGFTSAVRKT